MSEFELNELMVDFSNRQEQKSFIAVLRRIECILKTSDEIPACTVDVNLGALPTWTLSVHFSCGLVEGSKVN